MSPHQQAAGSGAVASWVPVGRAPCWDSPPEFRRPFPDLTPESGGTAWSGFQLEPPYEDSGQERGWGGPWGAGVWSLCCG